MTTFFDLLQSNFAYLLIAQIILVTLLFLGMLAVSIRRLKNGGNLASDGAEVGGGGADMAEFLALQEKLAQFEIEISRGKLLADENKLLREKVRYLESKLLEYEILQEEIGTLSALKLENENLKQELNGIQKKPTKATVYYEDPPKAASSPILAPRAQPGKPVAKAPAAAAPTPEAAPPEGLDENAIAGMFAQVGQMTEKAIDEDKKTQSGG